MELMTKAGLEGGLSKRLLDTVKRVIAAGEHDARDAQPFSDVDKIVFVPAALGALPA